MKSRSEILCHHFLKRAGSFSCSTGFVHPAHRVKMCQNVFRSQHPLSNVSKSKNSFPIPFYKYVSKLIACSSGKNMDKAIMEYRKVGYFVRFPKSQTKKVNHLISHVEDAVALYSASHEDLDVVLCFFDPQDMRAFPRKTKSSNRFSCI